MDNRISNNTNYIKTATLVLLFLFAVELAVVGIIGLQSNYRLQNSLALATTVKPETYTELYFEDHTQLPHILTVYKQYSFKFTIHNLENRDMIYPYEFFVDLENEKLVLDKGMIALKKGESKTIAKEFVVNDVMKKSRFVVELTNKDQQIGFWAEATK